METNEIQDEVVVGDVEESNEAVEENTEETTPKAEKPKRTPQEEYEYHNGRAQRLAKKLGIDKPQPKETTQEPSKSNDLDYGEKAYLRSAINLKGADEIQLAKEWKAKYNATAEEMETDEVFLNRLNNLRVARESAQAIPKSKNRSGQTGVTDVDMAIAKYKETGELPGDFNTRNKVIDAITKSESSALFSGPSVIN